ncbi:MAG: formylglycine-generating enzyme family protein, partial [Symploca sp. SIO2B6]|nr:formylglycine-generating enzyme family protein [Symploca sp. SIO2B6]
MSSTIQVNEKKVDFTYVQERLDSEVTLDLIQIPSGGFMMGSPDNEEGRSSDGREGPQHRVNISSFWMGQYPVTQAQWRIVAGLTQVNRPLEPEPSSFSGDLRPVEQVSWYDAVEFCDRLTQHTGRTYRLP